MRAPGRGEALWLARRHGNEGASRARAARAAQAKRCARDSWAKAAQNRRRSELAPPRFVCQRAKANLPLHFAWPRYCLRRNSRPHDAQLHSDMKNPYLAYHLSLNFRSLLHAYCQQYSRERVQYGEGRGPGYPVQAEPFRPLIRDTVDHCGSRGYGVGGQCLRSNRGS